MIKYCTVISYYILYLNLKKSALQAHYAGDIHLRVG